MSCYRCRQNVHQHVCFCSFITADRIRSAAMGLQKQRPHLSLFATKAFAYFLHVRCSSASERPYFAHRPMSDGIQRHVKYVNDMKVPVIADLLLLKSAIGHRQLKTCCTQQHQGYHLPKDPCEYSLTDPFELLQKCAVEDLTTYCQLQRRDFGSVATIVTTDYEAMYAYRRGDYQHCLQLSTENVQICSTPFYTCRVV